MLRHQSEIIGYAIHASDGYIGTVSDHLFEDKTWLVRWLVVDTGHWLPGRKVLLPPSVLAHINHIGRQFNVGLTRQQVKDCPKSKRIYPCRGRWRRAFTVTMAGRRTGAVAPIWAWLTMEAISADLSAPCRPQN